MSVRRHPGTLHRHRQGLDDAVARTAEVRVEVEQHEMLAAVTASLCRCRRPVWRKELEGRPVP